MSLTDREKEIASEVWIKYADTNEHINIMFDEFLSRVREEQEAFKLPFARLMHNENQEEVIVLPLKQWEKITREPLFTTPPAAPEPNKWDKALELSEAWKRGRQEARATQPTCDCSVFEMIKHMMATGTADSFMELNDEQKRMAFAVGVHESTLRKKLSDSCSELVEALRCLVDALQSRYVPSRIEEQAVNALINHAKRMKE